VERTTCVDCTVTVVCWPAAFVILEITEVMLQAASKTNTHTTAVEMTLVWDDTVIFWPAALAAETTLDRLEAAAVPVVPAALVSVPVTGGSPVFVLGGGVVVLVSVSVLVGVPDGEVDVSEGEVGGEVEKPPVRRLDVPVGVPADVELLAADGSAGEVEGGGPLVDMLGVVSVASVVITEDADDDKDPDGVSVDKDTDKGREENGAEEAEPREDGSEADAGDNDMTWADRAVPVGRRARRRARYKSKRSVVN
jgi:hypothetical protein